MSSRLVLLLAVIVSFGALTAVALADVGYLGIIAPHFQSWGAGQVFADLVIACVLAAIWMVDDARARGLNPWPFVALTLLLGSFGPLFYLVVRELRAPARVAVAST
jgi:hypothetical protein